MARRSRRPSGPNATLTAAATKIPLGDAKAAATAGATRQDWQAEAWAYFDEVPEIKESVRYRGNQIGKVRLYVATDNPLDPEGDPIPVGDPESGVPPAVAAAAEDELARLRSLVGGRAEILRMLDMNLEVSGECYLVGIGERTEQVEQRDGTTKAVARAEDWTIRSVSEVENVQGVYKVKASPSDTKPRVLDPEMDTCIRIWTRHPQWADQPDSAMRGLLGECRALQVLTQQVLAHANRSLSAGFFTVPNELSFGPTDPTENEDGTTTDPPEPLDAVMHAVLVAPIADPASAASVQPGLLRGPAEYLKADYLRRITFYDADLVAGLETRIEARIARIARGLNLPVEKIMGHQATTFANAAQVDEDEYNDYLAPSVDTATDALTWAFLWPQLEEHPDVPAEWVGLLYVAADPSALIAEPDTEANADGAWDRNTINDSAYRRAKGFSEDDAPEALELLIKAGLRRGILTADLTLALLNLLTTRDGLPAIELPEPTDGGSAPGDPSPEAVAQLVAAYPNLLEQMFEADPTLGLRLLAMRPTPALGAGPEPPPFVLRAATANAPGNDYGRALTEVDRELRARLLVAANDAMGRALERAANRLRSRANGTELRAGLRTVALRDTFAHLGPAHVATILAGADSLDGAWDELGASFATWGAAAQAEALDVLTAVAGGRLAPDQRDALARRQADDLADAWTWMAEALTTLATERMYNPDPGAPDEGEFDPTLRVPAGLVRQAIARAGGAQGLLTAAATAPGPAWVTLTDGGTRPAGGIGTGELMRGGLRDAGASVEAYRWTYGPAFREHVFAPHQALDGVVFNNFDDPVLANPHAWPPGAFYLPGDHAGSLAAGTVVSGPVPRGAALREWRGDLIDLSFATGQFLTATPNHPVLTGRGWVAAGELVEGDEVVRCVDAEGIAALVPHERQVPACIEDVVAAVAVTPGMVAARVEVAPEHFHGDGLGSQVAVVWSDRLLVDHDQAPLSQPASQAPLAVAGPPVRRGLASEGGASHGGGAVGPSTLGGMGSDGTGSPGFGGPAGGRQELRRRRTAGLDASTEQALADGVAIDAEALGQGKFGLSAHVQLDKVLHVDRRSGVATHVYDLQTDQRWYLANGVIVHNCVCDFEPVIVPAAPVVAAEAAAGAEAFPGFDTSKQVTAWMRDRYGLTADGKRRAISFDGMPPEVANELAESMDAMMRRYPRTAGRLRLFGDSAYVTGQVKASGVRVGNISGALADAQRDPRVAWVRFSKVWGKTPDRWRKIVDQNVASGFFPQGTGGAQAISSTATHEFGHHIKFRADEVHGKPAVLQRISSVLEAYVRSTRGLAKTDAGYAAAQRAAVEGDLSRYATTNTEELCAEAVSEVNSNPNPRPLARALHDMLVELAEG